MVALQAESSFFKLAAACIVHAVLVSALWTAAALFGHAVLSAANWTVVAALWLAWPILLIRRARNHVAGVIVTILASLAILSPSVPTMFTFGRWWMSGFAP